MEISKQKAFHSLAWSFLQGWGGKALSLAAFVVLSRLLPPEAFGTASAAALAIYFVAQISDFGYSDALIQKRFLSAHAPSLPFFTAIALACALSATVCIEANQIAAHFDNPALAEILRVTSFAAPLATMTLFQEAFFKRNLKFKTLTIRSLVANGIAGVVAVTAALCGAGVWSLVLQSLLVILISCLWLWSAPVWRPSGKFDWLTYKELSSFGFKVFCGRLLDFGATRLVEVVIGLRFGMVALGMYTVAARLFLTLMELLQGVISNAALALLSKVSHDKELLRGIYQETIATLSMTVSAGFVLLALIAPEVVSVIFGSQWEGAERLLRPLFLMGAVQSVQFMNGTFLLAAGNATHSLSINLFKAALVVGGMWLSDARDVEALVWVYVAMQIAAAPFSFLLIARELQTGRFLLFRDLIPPVSSSLLAFAAGHFVRSSDPFEKLGSLGAAFSSAAVFTIVYVACFTLFAGARAQSSGFRALSLIRALIRKRLGN